MITYLRLTCTTRDGLTYCSGVIKANHDYIKSYCLDLEPVPLKSIDPRLSGEGYITSYYTDDKIKATGEIKVTGPCLFKGESFVVYHFEVVQ